MGDTLNHPSFLPPFITSYARVSTGCALIRSREGEACVYLAVHPAQSSLLNDEITGRLQEVWAEVTLLDVIVLIAAVSRPGPGPERKGDKHQFKI